VSTPRDLVQLLSCVVLTEQGSKHGIDFCSTFCSTLAFGVQPAHSNLISTHHHHQHLGHTSSARDKALLDSSSSCGHTYAHTAAVLKGEMQDTCLLQHISATAGMSML